MTELKWLTSSPTEGISHGVVYSFSGVAYAWTGITSISDTTPQETAKQYFDGQPQTVSKPDGEYSATVKAYTYPEVLDDTLHFIGMSYRTSTSLHLVYNPLLWSAGSPSWDTDSSDQSLVEFEFSVSSLSASGGSVCHIVVDLEGANPIALRELEDKLYGTEDADPVWPTIDWVVESFEAQTILRIIDHGDGTWTAIGPDEAIKMVSPTEFEITWPSAIPLNSTTYTISSL